MNIIDGTQGYSIRAEYRNRIKSPMNCNICELCKYHECLTTLWLEIEYARPLKINSLVSMVLSQKPLTKGKKSDSKLLKLHWIDDIISWFLLYRWFIGYAVRFPLHLKYSYCKRNSNKLRAIMKVETIDDISFQGNFRLHWLECMLKCLLNVEACELNAWKQ